MKPSAVVSGLGLLICLQSHAQTPASVSQELAAANGKVDQIVATASNDAGRRMGCIRKQIGKAAWAPIRKLPTRDAEDP